MTAIGISRKLLKIIAIVTGSVVGILLGFHFWFVNHAEDILAELVNRQSNGKLKLQVEKFSYNWFKKRMELRKAVFYTTDDSTSPNNYRIEVERLQLRLKKFYPLIAGKTLLIDSLKLVNPVITVTSLRVPDNKKDGETLSIPQEMGRVYNSIRDALKVLEVDRFQIDNGKFSMVNKADPAANEKPVAISNIYFHLDNLRVDSAQGQSRDKILFSDNLALQTTHQDIFFPDGRHRLSFSNFRINLQHKLAEFDSCTITANKGDSGNNSFTVFFDKLKMTNIDFDTLYRSELIKADSVYCINPRFALNVNLKDNEPTVNTPRLDELVQQLTGDLQLKFVIVENGSFDINTVRLGHPSSFVSTHNNFEMQGLRIKKDAPRPLTVERFAMAIRNSENFVRDSAFSVQFDSILLINNRISLSNFAYKEYKNGKSVNRVAMPQFELYGLSWDHLVFDRRLKAEQIVLYKPVINYDLSRSGNDRPGDIFKALQEVNKLLQLHNLNIINGQLNLDFRNNAKLQLDNVTSFVTAQQLMKSRNLTGIQQAVNMLTFQKGSFTMDGLDAELEDMALTSSGNQLKAASINIRKKGQLAIQAKNISILSMLIDEKQKQLLLGGVKWDQASMDITTQSPSSSRQQPGDITIQNINGSKTTLNIHSPPNDISLYLQSVSANAFSTAGKKWQLDGFAATGNDLTLKNKRSLLQVDRFNITDKQPSSLENIRYTQQGNRDSVSIQITSANMVADINSLINKDFRVQSLTINKPLANMYLAGEAEEETDKEPDKWPMISIDKLRIQQPDIYIRKQEENETGWLVWKGADNNFLELEQLTTNNEGTGLKAGRLSFLLNRFSFRNKKGKTFNTREGQLSAEAEKLAFHKNEAGAWDWKGKLAQLSARDFVLDSIDKNAGKLVIVTAKLNDLAVSSSLLLNLYELVKHNTNFTLREITGNYQNNHNRFEWHNINFDKNTQGLSLDSFSYRPMQSQEDFVKTHPYQIDYAIVKTGRVNINGVNLERFLKDTVLDMRSISVDNARLDDFRDKRLPREPGIVRPLPVDHLKMFPAKISIDSLQLRNAWVKYGEYNEKTEVSGWIHVNRLNGLITSIRNYGASASDSLSIRATAYLEDSVFTALQTKGSYTDTAGGFVMQLQMGKADLKVLNHALGPLAGATLKSGYLDTMTMHVTGNNQVAYGEMVMAYRDLKVLLNGKPNQEKKSFFRGAVNSLVNTILRNKNTDRKGTVFFIRLHDRSALNYLVKITLSGVGSSVGLGKNRRQLNRYMRRHK